MLGRVAAAGASIFDYFQQKGLSPAQAAGIVGNTQQESSNNPNAPGGGLIQGQGGRTSSGTLQQQLEGVWRELKGPERGTLQALRGATSAQQAARIFSERFERPGEPMLSNRERYAAEALKDYGGGAGGASGGSVASAPAAAGSAGVPAASGPSSAQEADLAALVAQLGAAQQQSTSVAGISLPKPTEAAVAEPGVTAAPHAPRELPAAPASSPAQLLSLISQIGADTPEGAAVSSAPGAAAGAPASARPSDGGYVNPLPGFAKGRTDQGVDYSAQPGAPIKALGPGKVLGVEPNWYQGQPYLYYELTGGADKGKVVYVAEQITPHVNAGDEVKAGQTIGVYAPSGTGIETGFGTPSGQTQARVTSGYSEGQETPAGIQARKLLEALGAR